jgi:drug/metabolite transporter (DMT)-like permease
VSKRPHSTLLASMIAVQVATWSFNFIIGKVGLRYWSPLTLASFRVVLAALIMLPLYGAHRLWFRIRPGANARCAGLRGGRRDIAVFFQLGVLGVAINQICFTVGLNYTTVGHSAVIIGTGPISILLMAWALGLEALTTKKALGMALAFAGVVVLAAEHGLSPHSGTLPGDLITLAGSLAFALYTVLGKRVAEAYDSVSMNAYNFLIGAAIVLPLAARQAAALWRAGGWSAVAWQGWAALFYMAAGASVLAYLIYFWVLRYMTASRLGTFAYLQPVLTTLMGIGLLGERVTSNLLLGGGLVLTGVFLIAWGPREERREVDAGA